MTWTGAIQMNSKNAQSLNNSELAALARLFSTGVIQELARQGKSPMLGRLVAEGSISDLVAPSDPVRNLFDAAFELLQFKQHRHEYIYKSAITHKVLLGRHSLRTAVMLSEFRVGDRKADVVILNGSSAAYEIKSERDRLDRLQDQITAYMEVFSVVNVVAGENHLSAVKDAVPEDAGILLLNNRFQISTIREAVDDRRRVLPFVIFESLRLHEAREILEFCGVEVPKVPNTQERSVLHERFLRLKPQEAHDGMVHVLRKARSLTPLVDLVREMPLSLHAACVSTKIRKQDHLKLVSALDTPVTEVLSWA